jgi:uncharacterized membrane protein YoaK (UPF0700 family)
LTAPDARRAALPFVLSLIAGATDTIGFLSFRLFTAHVTGNLAVVAAHFITGNPVIMPYLVSVPVFMVALLLASLLGGLLERHGSPTLRPLLWLQLLLLIGATALCLAQGGGFNGGSSLSTAAAMLAVAAMAVQNSLVQVALKTVPTTAVMTTNVTRLVHAVAQVLTCLDEAVVRRAREQAWRILPVVLGFVLGCVIGAIGHAAFGHAAFGLPAGLALLALLMGRRPDH